MDYLYYIFAVLVMGLACVCAIRFAMRGRDPDLVAYQRRHAATSRRTPLPAGARKTQHGRVNLHRNARPGFVPGRAARVSAPWGWPTRGARTERPLLSARLHEITTRLLREKELASHGVPDARRQLCIRALLEDRYGRVHSDTMTPVEYRKVRPPRLRDPADPHDQMDNFGTREAEQLGRGLQRVRPAGGNRSGKASPVKPVDLTTIKQPWGW